MTDNIEIKSMIVSPAATNCYFFHLKGNIEAICVDPGDRGDAIADALEEEGLKLSAILLTHGHFDHILGVEALKRRFGAKVYAPKAEQRVLHDPALNLSGDWIGMPCTLDADEYLEDNAVIREAGFEIHMLLTPGHTEGGACFYLPAEGICFTGDTVFRASIGRTDLPTGNFETLIDSIRSRIMPLPEDTVLLPGHEGTSVLEWEKLHNPYFRGDDEP